MFFRDRFLSLCIVVMTTTFCLVSCVSNSKQNSMHSPDSKKLDQFQWAVAYGQELFLVKDENYLYPAMRLDQVLFESSPPKINVKLHHFEKTTRLSVAKIISPLDLGNSQYVADFFAEGEWLEASSFQLKMDRFEVFVLVEKTWRSVSLRDIRFHKKNGED